MKWLVFLGRGCVRACGWGGYSDSWCSGEKLTITGKAGNLLHSAEEVDVNEPLIAEEETLNGTRIHMQAHTGGRMLPNTCLHTHTHCWWNLYSLLWTITQILIPVLHPSISSCVHSHPPLRDVFKKKSTVFQQGWEISRAWFGISAWLTSSFPLFTFLALCFLPCTNSLPVILDPQFLHFHPHSSIPSSFPAPSFFPLNSWWVCLFGKHTASG